MKKYTLNRIEIVILNLIILLTGIWVGSSYQIEKYQPRIDGLHKQVNRQTKRIAELTGNGG